MLNVGDVQTSTAVSMRREERTVVVGGAQGEKIHTSGGDSSGNEDGAPARAEHLEGTLTLALGAVTVNGCGREALVNEEVGERIGHALSLDENKGQTRTMGVENVEEHATLVDVLDILDLLRNVLRRGPDTTDRKEDILSEEVAGKHLDVAGEGGRKHQGLTALGGRHVLTLDNAADLGLKTHVQHAVSLIEYEVLDVSKRNSATLDEVHKTTGSGNEKIATALNLAELRANVGATVDYARTDPRAVGKLPGLLENLRDKLTGRCEDEGGGVGLALTAKAGLGWRGAAGTVLVGLREDGEEETAGLAGTGLGASHQVTATHDDGDGVLLDGRRHLVPSKVNVGEEVVVERRVREGVDWVGNVLARSLNRDVVVLLEVDARGGLGRVVGNAEELTLNTLVWRARNVLAISP